VRHAAARGAGHRPFGRRTGHRDRRAGGSRLRGDRQHPPRPRAAAAVGRAAGAAAGAGPRRAQPGFRAGRAARPDGRAERAAGGDGRARLSRLPRRGAATPLFRDAAPPSARAGRIARDRHRPRDRPDAPRPRPRRHPDRHLGADAPRPAHRDRAPRRAGERGGARPVDPVLQLQARAAARPRHGARRAFSRQSVLARRAARPRRARPGRSGACRRRRALRALLRSGARPRPLRAPGLRGGGQEPLRPRLRLHRRQAPLRRVAERLAPALAADGWQVALRHRELDRGGDPAGGGDARPGSPA